ncbi:MAG: transketolase [bacterium]|nr:transketolase [bacterium]
MDQIQLHENLRRTMIRIAHASKSGHTHIGSCLSCIDIVAQTILFEMRRNDKFILSKGHASLALYVVLREKKRITDEMLDSYFCDGGHFGIHPPSSLPDDIPLPTGSLGHGLSFGCGVAKGFLYRRKKPLPRVFVLLSDGECNEGAVWEAAMFASHHQLNNLVALIDRNGWQAFGRTKEVLGDAAAPDKWRAFGFNTYRVNGHRISDLQAVFKNIRVNRNGKPHAVICDTVRGKGIKTLHDQLHSNYTTVDTAMLLQATGSH